MTTESSGAPDSPAPSPEREAARSALGQLFASPEYQNASPDRRQAMGAALYKTLPDAARPLNLSGVTVVDAQGEQVADPTTRPADQTPATNPVEAERVLVTALTTHAVEYWPHDNPQQAVAEMRSAVPFLGEIGMPAEVFEEVGQLLMDRLGSDAAALKILRAIGRGLR